MGEKARTKVKSVLWNKFYWLRISSNAVSSVTTWQNFLYSWEFLHPNRLT